MPTTYAHYRFGKEVLAQLPDSIQKQTASFRGLFDIGLHGPDLLFYYKALFKNPINQTGFAMHERPGSEFFSHAASVINQAPDYEGAVAYLDGFLCHFALDSCCHPYVEEMVRKTGISHSEIEAELDRRLMVTDGLNPITYRPTGHLHDEPGYAAVISTFFPTISQEQISKSIRSIAWYCNRLVCPNPVMRRLLFLLLKLAHSYDSIHGMVINYQPNPACIQLCNHLLDLYEEAIPAALKLIENYHAYLRGEAELNPEFAHTFGED